MNDRANCLTVMRPPAKLPRRLEDRNSGGLWVEVNSHWIWVQEVPIDIAGVENKDDGRCIFRDTTSGEIYKVALSWLFSLTRGRVPMDRFKTVSI